MSGDGRYVVFASGASNLVPGGTSIDVFIHDRVTGVTEVVSVSSAGERGNGMSTGMSSPPAVSGDGGIVAFSSAASNLLGDGNDTNAKIDIFVRDRDANETTRVSVASDGTASSRRS